MCCCSGTARCGHSNCASSNNDAYIACQRRIRTCVPFPMETILFYCLISFDWLKQIMFNYYDFPFPCNVSLTMLFPSEYACVRVRVRVSTTTKDCRKIPADSVNCELYCRTCSSSFDRIYKWVSEVISDFPWVNTLSPSSTMANDRFIDHRMYRHGYGEISFLSATHNALTAETEIFFSDTETDIETNDDRIHLFNAFVTCQIDLSGNFTPLSHINML